MKKIWKPVNLDGVTTYPLGDRDNKVSIHDFAARPSGRELDGFLSTLPQILKAADFLEFVDLIVAAYRQEKPIIVMLGGHVIKCGLSPILIDLMERGIITAMAFNGATSIHDFEIGLIGETSEDVGQYLQTGQFGMVEETGRLMNEAICAAADTGIGMGAGLGQKLIELDAPYRDYSLLATGVRLGIPITVHVAIGTDIIHQHPAADGAAIGLTSFTDFRLLTAIVAELGDGGVVLNLGSAVILPEVFSQGANSCTELGKSGDTFYHREFRHDSALSPVRKCHKTPNRYRWKGLHFYGTPRDNDSAASGSDYWKVRTKSSWAVDGS